MNKSELGIMNRAGLPEDENFIYASWLRSAYYDHSPHHESPKNIFMTNYHNIIENLLEISSVKVVCFKDSPSTILGYVVLSKDESTLHYAYCKKSWRKIGLIKGLLGDNIKTVTEVTDIGRSYLKNHPNVVYNPYAKEIIECQIKNEVKKISNTL